MNRFGMTTKGKNERPDKSNPALQRQQQVPRRMLVASSLGMTIKQQMPQT
jgi:hypothetical protein